MPPFVGGIFYYEKRLLIMKMVEKAEFVKQSDGYYVLCITMIEDDYIELKNILDSLNLTFEQVIDLFFRETIKLGRLPFDY